MYSFQFKNSRPCKNWQNIMESYFPSTVFRGFWFQIPFNVHVFLQFWLKFLKKFIICKSRFKFLKMFFLKTYLCLNLLFQCLRFFSKACWSWRRLLIQHYNSHFNFHTGFNLYAMSEQIHLIIFNDKFQKGEK